MTRRKCFSISVQELIGKCNNNTSEWKAPICMEVCSIHGMTSQMLDVVYGEISDDVSCANYVDNKLFLGMGAVAQLKLTKMGYGHDAHISLDMNGVLKISIPPNNIRQKLAA